MSLTFKHIYRFDSFVLDVDERVLLRDGRMVPLTPKVFETLLLLVRNQGSIVTKQKILDTLWPDVFVEESNITFNITMLRKALGDTKRSSVHIETVPRRGYRFKTEVREVHEEENGPATVRVAALSGNRTSESKVDTLIQPRRPLELQERSSVPQMRDAHVTWQPSSLPMDRRRIPLPLLFLLAAILLLAAALAWKLSARSGKEKPRVAAQMPLIPAGLKFEQITTYGNVISAAISPDGKQVAYVEENNGEQSLWIKQVATSINVQIAPPVYSVYNKIAFSHDGNYIYFVQHAQNESSDLYRIPILGGPPAKLVRNVEEFSLSPDDQSVVFKRRNRIERQDTLYLGDLNSGQERQLLVHKAPDWLWTFSWSPDGQVIICATGETDSARQTMGISVVDVQTGAEKLLVKPNWYFIRQFEWLPDGKGVLICAKEKLWPEIWVMSYPGAELHKLTDDLNYYLSISLTAQADKMIAVQSKLASQVWISPSLDVSKARNIAGGRGKLAWMPDGRIVYDYASRSGSDLWIAKSDGTDPKQLIFNSGFNDWPAVSSDGRSIVFQSDRTGAQHLWRMNPDGSNQVQLTNGYAERNASISPDGKWVFYNSSTDNSLWKIGLDGGQPVKLTDDYAAYPSVSPDGKLLACFRFPKYGHEATIAVRSTDNMRIVAELSLAPGFWISRSIAWDTDSAVIYALQSEGKVKLFRQPLKGPPHQLTNLKAEDEFEFALSPDNKRLAFISSKWDHDIVLIDGLK
jgi:Tol biopolymer transport system component/DNA-binding winged helix-turn-helix (wHTH) protein